MLTAHDHLVTFEIDGNIAKPLINVKCLLLNKTEFSKIFRKKKDIAWVNKMIKEQKVLTIPTSYGTKTRIIPVTEVGRLLKEMISSGNMPVNLDIDSLLERASKY